MSPTGHITSHNRDGDRESWDPRVPTIKDNLSILEQILIVSFSGSKTFLIVSYCFCWFGELPKATIFPNAIRLLIMCVSLT